MERSQAALRRPPGEPGADRPRREAGDADLAVGPGPGPERCRRSPASTARAGRSSAPSIWSAAGVLIGWHRIDVPGATGYLDTDYASKGRTGIAALDEHDLVCVHVEAPDEASHEGRADEKVKALERIDEHIVGPLLDELPKHGEWRILVEPGPPHDAADAGPRLRGGAVRVAGHGHPVEGADELRRGRRRRRRTWSSTRAGS